MKGKLIVIEGTDGSGKATQVKLLVDRLRKEGQKIFTLAFPQYGKTSAKLIEAYLQGKFGDPREVNPYAASLFYGIDRRDIAAKISSGLTKGETGVLDRYTDSNAGHQGGKIHDPKERDAFLAWLYEVEYRILGVPKPDIVLILHVPVAVTLELIKKRGRQTDGHETDVEHLKNAEASYLQLAQKFPENHKVIECVEDGKMLPPERIHEKVYSIVGPMLAGMPIEPGRLFH